MPSFKRTANAVWRGPGADGAGMLSGPSGVLTQTPYSAKARFQNEDGKAGTNPEELIAAAHAGCYIMALSFQLSGAGYPPAELRCSATIDMNNEGGGWSFQAIHLDLVRSARRYRQCPFTCTPSCNKGCPLAGPANIIFYPRQPDIQYGLVWGNFFLKLEINKWLYLS